MVASARVEQRPAGRAAAPAATASIKETGRLDQLTSSSRATQHSSPSLSNARSADTASQAAQGEPVTSLSAPQHAPPSSASQSLPLASGSRLNGTEHDDDRMRDIAAAKRARELGNAPPVPATPVATANSGFVHPARQLLMSDGHPTSMGVDDSGKEEADPSSGQDKRRRTMPHRSTASSSSTCATARRVTDTPPTVDEFNQVVAELQASREESSDLRARLEQLERRVEALLSASPSTTGVSPLAARAAVPARDNTSATAPPAAISPTAATTRSETVSAPPALPCSQPARQYSLAEPKAALLSNVSLPPYSTTDLMLDVCLPPLTIKMARGRFPNHTTQHWPSSRARSCPTPSQHGLSSPAQQPLSHSPPTSSARS